MPKLPKNTAQRVASAESKSFEAIPAGRYVLVLREVTVSDKPGPSGAHYWNWEFEVESPEVMVENGEEVKTAGRRLWTTTSLAESADWKMKEVFDAFGYTTDSDTDEMIGERVVAYVSQAPIEKGARKGEMSNTIDRLAPYEEGDEGGGEGDQF